MRWPILIGQAVIATIGLLIMLYAGPPGVRYFGLFLATWGTQGNVPASLGYGQNQTAKVQKRAIVAAATISVGAAGGVVGSSIFQAKDAPVCYSYLVFVMYSRTDTSSNTCRACGRPYHSSY